MNPWSRSICNALLAKSTSISQHSQKSQPLLLEYYSLNCLLFILIHQSWPSNSSYYYCSSSNLSLIWKCMKKYWQKRSAATSFWTYKVHLNKIWDNTSSSYNKIFLDLRYILQFLVITAFTVKRLPYSTRQELQILFEKIYPKCGWFITTQITYQVTIQ